MKLAETSAKAQGLGVSGLGFRVWGLGFRVLGFPGIRALGSTQGPVGVVSCFSRPLTRFIQMSCR